MAPLLPVQQPDIDCYSKINNELADLNDEYDIFLQVTNLEDLINNIIIPQSEIYATQKGEVFSVSNEEIKSFLGLTILMGIHKLPELRDYWSAESSIGVEYIANVMTVKRFE